MQQALDDFCKAIIQASNKINSLLDQEQSSFYKNLSQFETNIHSVLKRLESNDFPKQVEISGIQKSEQQLDQQRNFNKLLSDQNRAFGEFLIALQLIAYRLHPEDIYDQITDYRNTATKLDVSISDVMFNRFLGDHDGVDKKHADQNLQTFNNIYKKKGDINALGQDELILALSQVEGNKDLIQKLQQTTNLKDFILLLTQAGAVATAAKDQNALSAINQAVHGDKNSYAQMTNEGNKPLTEAQKQQALTTEGTYTNNSVQQAYQKSITMQSADAHITQSPDANVNYKQQIAVSTVQTQSRTDAAKADEYNLAAYKMENNPAMTTMIMAALEYKKQIDSLTGSTVGATGSISNFGGSLKNLSEVLGQGEGKIGGFFSAITKFTEGAAKLLGKGAVVGAVAGASVEVTKAAVIGWYGAKRVFGNGDGIAPKVSAKERVYEMSLARDELSNDKNQAAIEYLRKKQGITVKYNQDMLRFEALKDGKVIANLGRKLGGLQKNVSALIDPKNQAKIKELERRTGGNVQIDETTGQVALFRKGILIGNVDLTQRVDAIRQANWTNERAVGRDSVKAEEDAKSNQQSADLSKSIDQLNDQVSGKKTPPQNKVEKAQTPIKTTSVPNVSDAKPAFPDASKASQQDNITKTSVHVEKSNKPAQKKNKKATAHDLQMAKECSHIENSNNSYKYDVKITVNPPSGDPIKIAQQVCEQLKQHTCGNNIGYSKDAASRARTGQ